MLKRSIDVVGALPLLMLTSPLLAVTAVALRLEGYGPVLYRSPRVERGGRPRAVPPRLARPRYEPR
jgi:lipopolysaccharide/colanic/teichoic acid biosynthesis glycosyltransferase